MPVMAMIFGSALIRDEIDDKSITHVATAPLDRAFSYLGYYLPLVIAVAVSMVAISSVGVFAFFGQHGFGSEALQIYVEFLALVIIGSFVYSSLFLAIGVMFNKPVMVGLFYAFIWEGYIGSLPGAIQNASVKHYLRSLGSEWVDFGDISRWDQASSVWGSTALLLGLTVFLLVRLADVMIWKK
jgi:ABC-type transport system involved in multi-copper enzyme maturation permease subunit